MDPVFGRGLPQGDILHEIPGYNSEVIRKESIVFPDFYLTSNPENDDNRWAALRKISHSGWLHTEIRADIDGMWYTCASPLHRRCIDWKLNGSPLESGIIEPNLFEFALAVIQRFSWQKREIESAIPGRILLRIIEARKGFCFISRACYEKRKDRFLHRLKKRGVELLRDGNNYHIKVIFFLVDICIVHITNL